MCTGAQLVPLVGAMIGLVNKPKAPDVQAPAAPPAPPQESKAPTRAAMSSADRAASALYGGTERASIDTPDAVLGRSALNAKGNDKLGA